MTPRETIPPGTNRQRVLWRRSYLVGLALTVLALFLAGVPASTQERQAEEAEVKAAFLYNFGKFVRWPSSAPQDNFTICILGEDPFGTRIDSIAAGDSIDEKPLAIRRITSPQEAVACRILFISASEEPHVRSILPVLKTLPLLTVSDMHDFVDRGGMIEFLLRDGRVRFEINLDSANSSGLSMSSQLLKVALRVKHDRKGGE